VGKTVWAGVYIIPVIASFSFGTTFQVVGTAAIQYVRVRACALAPSARKIVSAAAATPQRTVRVPIREPATTLVQIQPVAVRITPSCVLSRMFESILRPLPVIALTAAAACALGATPAQAASKVRTAGYKLAVPAPGHVTAAALEVTARKHGRGRPATRVLLNVPGQFSMPDSVRIFFARRRLSGSPLRYELLFLVVNRAPGHTAASSVATAYRSSSRSKHRRHSRRHHRRAQRASRVQVDAGTLTLSVPSRPAFGHSCGSCGRRLPKSTSCRRCWFRKTTTRQAQVVNVDTSDSSDVSALAGMLRRGWTNNGDTNSVFGNPSTGSPRDSLLDAGFLDDNRAFGWNPASLADTAPIDHGVVDDILSGQLSKIVPDLEIAGQADLNGNGRIDGATSPGGGAAA